ncbi:MAG: hypothetical protein JSW55_02225 [Chloroflexota bacterium]|nr:MAG: hypothetical protein JSW55_02225 [Chloroflexota bacterium]
MNQKIEKVMGSEVVLGRAWWLMLGGIVVLAAVVLWLAPAEQTLGSGITSVYVHVALTWSGMTGLIVAAALGLAAALLGRSGWQDWGHVVGWVGLGMFAAGLIMSAVAAGINWGNVFWQEPRFNSALQILAVGLIVQVVNSLPLPYRLRGLLQALPAALLIWLTMITPLVLHPGNAARTSPSAAIRFTFIGLYVLCCLAGAWIVLAIRRHWPADGPVTVP